MPDDMTNVGRDLARARHERGLSLGDISRRTKIGIPALKAIERNQMDKLPGGVFTRGFLRAYAVEVGCDPERIVAQYREQVEEQESPIAAVPVVSSGPRAASADELHVVDIESVERRRVWTARLSGAMVIVASGAFFLMIGRTEDRNNRVTNQTPVVASASVVTPNAQKTDTNAETGTAGVVDSEKAVAAVSNDSGTDLHVTIELHSVCWLSAIADGQRVLYRLMNPEERPEIDAHQDIVLRIGDAGNVAFTINGRPARPLGPVGQPVTVHMTRDNYRDLLARDSSSDAQATRQ